MKNTKIRSSNQKTRHFSKNLSRRARLGIFLTLLVVFSAGVAAPIAKVKADRFDDQIKAIQSDNSQKSVEAKALQVQADSLQGTINALQSQITALQNQINQNQAHSEDLQKQIDAAQAELDKQKKVLGENIKAMYLDGQTTTIEMLASSKDLSDFFDKQQYRDVVKTKIKTTLDKVTALKSQLKDQKDQLTALIAQQQALNGQLSAQKAEQDRLLNLTQSQQNDLNAQIKANFSKISDLRTQQAIENAKLFIGGSVQNIPDTTGYPWANAGFPSGGFDPWGMEYRQCVSYTAWKVWRTGRNMPPWGLLGLGNANQWDDDARAQGIPVDGTPRVGDVAIKNSQPYGHAMYVENVNGDGTITVSQYNADLTGHYSVGRLYSAGLEFIHF